MVYEMFIFGKALTMVFETVIIGFTALMVVYEMVILGFKTLMMAYIFLLGFKTLMMGYKNVYNSI